MTTVAHGVGERLGERLGDRVQRIPATDLRSYVLAVLEEIHRVVPSTFSCFGVADPATGLLACSIKSQEPPCSDEEIVLHELAGPDVNQFADLARRADPVGSLWLDTDGHPETCHRFADFLAPRRTRDATGRWVTIRAAPMSDGATVVLSVTATSAVELFPLATGAFGLTRREQEVADLVLQGASTAAIAKALVLSPHTVQDHLKSIFRKCGGASRRDLVARFIGSQ